MAADDERDPVDRWLDQRVQPLPPPEGTFELITRRARRRKVRKALISAGSAAAVAAAVAIAVPVSMSLNVSTPPSQVGIAAGNSSVPTQPGKSTVNGAARTLPAVSPSAGAGTPAPTPSATTGPLSSPGSLPADFQPSSVTWDSLSSGWVIGQAGTAGQCAGSDPDICTSVARTTDGGSTWSGLPAPTTGAPSGTTGVSGLRFLNGTYGWAFGPELWSTSDGGERWTQVNAGGSSVTDLETANGRAFALFGSCTSLSSCTSFTLKTTTSGSGDWTGVGGIPASLTAGGGAGGSAEIVLAGSTGYLVAPDGTLYSGPLGGGAWHKVSTLPCTPGKAGSSGLPGNVQFASASASELALTCEGGTATAPTLAAYTSADGGATWKERSAAAASGATIALPQSLTATSAGTFILASDNGIYLLSPDASSWAQATLSDQADGGGGFTYVGMTSATQGVALGGSSTLYGIWMTSDGGQTWTATPIKS